MAKATLFSRLLSQEDLEPNLVENEVIGNVKNEEDNSDEIVSQGSVRDKELVVQESLLNENDNWGPGETIKTLWHAIRERAGGLGNFFLNMFKSYNASGLRKLLTELESGSRVVKTELTDTDKEKLNKIFGSIGEFDYDVGGNCKDIITFINNVMDTLDKNKRGSFGWILDNKFDIENGRKALVKDKVSSELFSRLLKAHPEGFSIDPRSDNYVAGYIVNPFATHLSIYSIMYIPQLDSIKTESDIIRNPRPANVFPATLDGAKALLKFGIDFEDKIKNLASKIKLDSLKTSTIESHLSLRDAAYYSARALSTLDRKLEDAIKVFTKRHTDTSNEDLEPNLVENKVKRKAFLNNTTAAMESYSLSKEFFGLFGNKEERRKKLCYGIPSAETTINVEFLKNKLETIKKLDIPSSFNSYKSLAPIVLLATFKYNTANIAAAIKAMANNIRVFATAIKTDELSPDKVVRGLKYIRYNLNNIAAKTNYGNEEIFAIDVWRNNTYEEVIFRSQTIEVTTVGNAFNNPDPKQLNNTVIAGGWSFHKDDNFIGSWFSVDEWSKGYDKQDGHTIKIANAQELIKAIEELIKVYEKDYKDINSFKDLAYTKNSENYPRGYNYGRFIKEMYVEVSDAAYNIAKMTINMLLLSVNESTEELTALENMKGCDVSSDMFKVKPVDQLTEVTESDTHMEDIHRSIDTDVSAKLNETVDNLNDAIDSNDEVLMTKVGEATVEMLQELKYEYSLPVMTTVSKEDFIYDPKGCCKKLSIELSNEFFGWFGGKKETNKGPKCGAMHGDGMTGINDSSAKCLSLISKFKRLKETITSDKKTFVTKSLDNNMIVISFKPTYSTSIYACMEDMLNNLKSIDKYISSNYNHKDFFKTLKDVSKYLKPKVLENYKPRSNDKLLAVTWEFINIGNRREHYLYGTSVTHSDIDYGGAILDAVYIGNPYSQSGFSFYIEETKGVVDSYTKGYSAKSEIDSTLKILEELEPLLEKLKKYNSTHITSNKYILDIEDPEGSKEDKISDIVYSIVDNGIGDCLLGIVSLANAIYHCMLDTFEESDLSE